MNAKKAIINCLYKYGIATPNTLRHLTDYSLSTIYKVLDDSMFRKVQYGRTGYYYIPAHLWDTIPHQIHVQEYVERQGGWRINTSPYTPGLYKLIVGQLNYAIEKILAKYPDICEKIGNPLVIYYPTRSYLEVNRIRWVVGDYLLHPDTPYKVIRLACKRSYASIQYTLFHELGHWVEMYLGSIPPSGS